MPLKEDKNKGQYHTKKQQLQVIQGEKFKGSMFMLLERKRILCFIKGMCVKNECPIV